MDFLGHALGISIYFTTLSMLTFANMLVSEFWFDIYEQC